MLRLISLKIFENPSIYSHKPVAKLELEMGSYIDKSSIDIVGLKDRLILDLPGLANHQCSRGYPGGFLERLAEGTYLPHIIEHICLEMQAIFGYDVGYGKTRWSQEDVYSIVFAYENKQLVKPLVDFVLAYIRSILDKKDFDFRASLVDLKRHIDKDQASKGQIEPAYIIAISKDELNSRLADLLARLLSSRQRMICIKKSSATYIGKDSITEKAREKGKVLGKTSGPLRTGKDTDTAILELDSQGILSEGLPYTRADMAIITGLLDEHLGERHIETIDQVIYIKSLLVEAVKESATVILNADDPYYPDFANKARARILPISFSRENPIIKGQIKAGKEAVYCFEDGIYLAEAGKETRLLEFRDMPAKYVASYLIYDILAALSAAYVYGIPVAPLKQIFLSQLRKDQYRGLETLEPASYYIH